MILIEANSINTNSIHSFLIFNNNTNMQREQRTSQLPERQRVEKSLFEKYFAHALPKKDNNTTIKNDFNDTIKEVRNKILNPNASCVTAKNLPIKKANNSMKKKIATKKHLQLKKISLEEAKLRHNKDSESILIEEVSSEEEEENDEDRAFIVSDDDDVSDYEPAEEIEDSDMDESAMIEKLLELKEKEKTDKVISRYERRIAEYHKKELRNTLEVIQKQKEQLEEMAMKGLKQSLELERLANKVKRITNENNQLKKDTFDAIACVRATDEASDRLKERAKQRERAFLDFLAYYAKNQVTEEDIFIQFEKYRTYPNLYTPQGLEGASKYRGIEDESLDDLASDIEEEPEEEKSSQEY